MESSSPHSTRTLSRDISLLRRLLSLLLLLKLSFLILIKSRSRNAVKTQNRLVRILDKNVLLDRISRLIGIKLTNTINNCTNNTPSITKVQVHLGSEFLGLVTDNAQNDVTSRRAGVSTRHETKFHAIGLGKDSLGSPAGKLAGVVLHLGCEDGTTLGDELGAPVKGAAGTGSLAVELVQGLDGELLVGATGGVLHDGVDFGTDDHLEGFLITLQANVEAAVLVTLGGERLGLLSFIVEGVRLVEGNLGLGVLGDGLQGEVVVDEGSLHGEGGGSVDLLVLGRGLGDLQGGIVGVLVDGDQVQRSTVTLVEVDLIALVDDDNIPRVDGASSAHEHGENVRGSKDGGSVLLGQLVDDRVLGGSHVVSGAVEGLDSALGILDRRLVVGTVVVVEETVAVEILTLRSIEVQLRQTSEVDFLQHLPLRTDVD